MNSIEATAAPSVEAAVPPVPPRPGLVRFLGRERDYWRLLGRGAVLLMLTLGIYRFWLTTDVRRFLWGNTEVGGHTFEYNGTAVELLLGFLIAIALLMPVYFLFFLAAIELGVLGTLASVAAFIVLAFLGQFAVYRARRYRLTRTIYRGVRFQQTGSAWRYSVCAVFWWVMIALTLGLAYPWAQASLERFKLQHTHYGNVVGFFTGSAFRLFLRGFPMWLLVMGPFVCGIGATVTSIDWAAFSETASHSDGDLLANSGIAEGIVFGLLGIGGGILAAAVLYPAFQAMTLRWWLSGLRIGDVAMTSHLRTSQIYGAYVRFLWYGLLFSIVAALVGAGCWALVDAVFGSNEGTPLQEISVAALLVLGYVALMLGFSTIYQATVKLALWRLSVTSLNLSGLSTLDTVKAIGGPSSAVGEGLADALNVGSF